MHECKKCTEYGLQFNRNYLPEEFIEGNPEAKIWIIGLNPKEEPSWQTLEDLRTALDNERDSYFVVFRKVSQSIMLHSNGNAAHTDLVKCAHGKWPTEGRSTIVRNCRQYLELQLQRYTPRIIICNGSDVSREVQKIIVADRKLEGHETQYQAKRKGHTVTVILSGFLGRQDNFARRRLGYEVESALQRDL